MKTIAESSEPGGVERIDPRAVLAFLRERKWAILGTVGIVLVAVVFWTVRQPKVYEAVATIQYDPSPPRPLGSEVEDITTPNLNYWMTQEWYQTQNKIISSRTVAERVVRDLGLNHSPEFFYVSPAERSDWDPATVSDAALVLMSRLTVEQAKDARIVAIRFRDRDPERATVIANAIANAYIDYTREQRLHTTSDALRYLAGRLDELTRELQGAEQALHDFREENNVLSVSLEDHMNVVGQDLERYSAALAEAHTHAIAVEARLSALRAANDADPMEVDATLVTQNPAVGALRDSIRETQAELSTKSVRYGQNHPEVRALEARLETLRSQMREEIDSLLNGAASDLDEARKKEAGLREALEDVQERGLELNLHEIEYNALKRRRANTEKLYDLVLQRTTETDLTKLQDVSTVSVVDPALEPVAPVSPRLMLNLALGLIGGVLAGLGVALLFARMDRTIKTVSDAEEFGLTVLGVLPRIIGGQPRPGRKIWRGTRGKKRLAPPTSVPSRDLIVHTQPMSAAAECARSIRTNLTFMAAEHPLRTLVLTSPNPLEGKTTVAISLAIALAQGGKRVVLVDTDMRRPRLHRAFESSPMSGITSILVGQESLDSAIESTDVPNLSLLGCGPVPPNPSELLHTQRFVELVQTLRDRFDHVIFDSPPLGAVTDSAIVAPRVDGVVLVLRSEGTTRDATVSALKQLEKVGANVVGGVLNDVDLAKQQAYYGGYYYHGYYGSHDDESDGRRDTAAAAE